MKNNNRSTLNMYQYLQILLCIKGNVIILRIIEDDNVARSRRFSVQEDFKRYVKI